MSAENRVAVVGDTGSSLRPEDQIVKDLGISLLPLHLTFFNSQGHPEGFLDTEITPEEFYAKMAASGRLPQTSGAVLSQAWERYKKLAESTDTVMSVHLTGAHSEIFNNAVLASREVMAEKGGLAIEVIDSRNISAGAGFLVLEAAGLAQQGADLGIIKARVLEMVSKVHTLALFSDLSNLAASGRLGTISAILGSLLKIYPIIGPKDGVLQVFAKERTMGKTKDRLVEMVFDRQEKILQMAVIHTNAPDMAGEMKRILSQTFTRDEIGIFEAGPALGVHAGPGAVGVSFFTE